MSTLTLLRAGNPLSNPAEQRAVLNAPGPKDFDDALIESGIECLCATGIEVLQVNVGKLCNQTCAHCHVDAGPDRREVMSAQVATACLDVLAASGIATLDITGGAPEMNPEFRRLVVEGRRLGKRVIDRSNLTILLAPGFRDLPEFLAAHQVEIVASLPCYSAENTDRQRGNGVFARSIEALQRLNNLGYGRPETGLSLVLVYNPIGPSLPPPQAALAEAYHRELDQRYGIVFNGLYTITNMPISRFLDDLVRTGRYDEYMQKLINAYNPVAAGVVMCRTLLSVGWDGRLYDCDFNQMLDLELASALPRTIDELRSWLRDGSGGFELLARRRIITGRHCFGCTAGAGSSCTGAIARS
ncbi:MAG: arsenosugar biosynthesis radical SAM (seleno)protein ArsS [Pirellulales bacterium]